MPVIAIVFMALVGVYVGSTTAHRGATCECQSHGALRVGRQGL